MRLGVVETIGTGRGRRHCRRHRILVVVVVVVAAAAVAAAAVTDIEVYWSPLAVYRESDFPLAAQL